MSDIHISRGFSEAERGIAATLYWAAFGAKLGKLLGPQARALDFLERIMDPQFALTARTGGALVGLAGFKTTQGSLVGGQLADMSRSYGWVGTLWRAPLLAVLERDLDPGILLMDGICVSPEARGKGVGTLLLREIMAEAARRQLEQVRLDVINTNPHARRLYEREGFVAQQTQSIGPLKWVFGFGSSTTMLYEIS